MSYIARDIGPITTNAVTYILAHGFTEHAWRGPTAGGKLNLLTQLLWYDGGWKITHVASTNEKLQDYRALTSNYKAQWNAVSVFTIIVLYMKSNHFNLDNINDKKFN